MSDVIERDEPTQEVEESPRTDTWLFVQATSAAVARAPLWLTTWAVLSVLAAAVAAPWYGWFGEATAHRLAPGEAVRWLSENFRQDHSDALGALGSSTSRLGVVLFPLVLLFGVFAAGGWLQVVLERSHGRSMRRFCFGGARYFWRFVRVMLLVLLLLALVRWLVYGMPWERLVLGQWQGIDDAGRSGLEGLDTEIEARRLEWLQHGVGTLLFALVLVWGTFTRTRLALHGTRSALWAGFCTFGNLLRHPIKTLRPMGLLLLFELAVVSLGLGFLTRLVDRGLETDASWARVGILLALGSFGLLFREILRGAKYIAAVRVSQEIIRPTSRLDPWRSIGGPGGPQYPVDDAEDEYGVSM